MLPVYKVRWPFGDEEVAEDEKVSKPVISWSRSNWIAFSTGPSWHLHHDAQQKQSLSQPPLQLGIDSVFIMNPNEPDDIYPVSTHHNGVVEHIEWNNNITSFLTCDSFGVAKIWQPENHLMNQWKSSHSVDLGEGDSVRKVFWLSNCRKYGFNIEKMYSAKDILEKFSSCASNVLWNTCSEKKDGIVAITSGGLFKIVMLEEFAVSNVYQKSLGSLNISIIKADVSINDGGKIFIAALTNPTTVELFSVNCKQVDDTYDLVVEVWPCLVPHNSAQEANFSNFEITHLRCSSVNNIDQIIICSKGKTK